MKKSVQVLQAQLEEINKENSGCPKPAWIDMECQGGRNVGKTIEVLKNLQQIIESTESVRSRPKVLIVGMGVGSGGEVDKVIHLSKHMALFVEALKQSNVDVIYHIDSIGAFKEEQAFKIKEIDLKYNHSYAGVFSDIDGKFRDAVKRLSEIPINDTFRDLNESLDVLKKKNSNVNKQKSIQVRGKSSKKGKSNPNPGSKFHK